MGSINNHGYFTPDPSKKRVFVVPESMSACKLRPYVSHTTPRPPLTYNLYDVEWYYREALRNDAAKE